MMKKTFIPFAALALLTLVACGGNTSSSTSTPAGTSEAPSTTSAAPAEKSSEAPVATSEEGPIASASAEAPISSEAEPASSEEAPVSSEEGPASSESSAEPIAYSAEITNKAELQAEWHVREANRPINLNLSPRTNILVALNDGTLVISSSDESVVKIEGKNAIAIGAGTATITVDYQGATDSVDVTVQDALVEPDYASKTITEVMAVEDLVQDDKNFYGHEAYLTQVKVAVIGSKKDGSGAADKYGNMYVTDPASTDAEPALIQVYGAGASIDALVYNPAAKIYKYSNVKDYLTNEETAAIKVGDVLDVIAIRADYQTTPEISMVIRAINGKVLVNAVRDTDEINATEDSPNVRKQLVSVTGKITGWATGKEDGTQYGNFYLQTEGSNGLPVYVYGATASASAISINNGALKFSNPKDFLTNEATKDLKIGDTITLDGFRCDYNGVLELNGIVRSAEEPIPEPEPKTSLEGIAAGDKLNLAEVTVAAVNTKAIAVTDGARGLYVYLGKAPEVAVGDVVSLEGSVVEYHGFLQVDSDGAKVTKLTGKTPVALSETALTAATVDGWKAGTFDLANAGLYTWETTAAKSGNFFTLNIEGSEVLIEPSNVPDSFGLTVGKKYNVKAYFTGYDTKYDYAAVVLVSAEEVPGQETPAAKTSIAEITADGQDVELAEVTVIATSTKAYAVYDGTNYAYVWKNGTPDVAMGDVISLTGTSDSYNGVHQITSPVATKLEGKTPLIPVSTELTKEILDAFPSATAYNVHGVYHWTTTVGKSGNFQTLNLAGSEVVIEYANLPSEFTFVEGKSYNVMAFYNGYQSKNNFAQMTIMQVEEVPEMGYYLTGSFNNWVMLDTNYTLTKLDEQKEGKDQYAIKNVEFAAGAALKITGGISVDSAVTWYPDGIDNDYIVSEAGKYDVYFVPEGGIEGWYEGFFNVVKAEEVPPVVATSTELLFNSETIKKYSNNYTGEAEVESDNYEYVVSKGNTGTANDAWGHVRFGSKKNAVNGSVTTKEAFVQAVSSVDVDYYVDSNSDKIESVKLIVSADSTFDSDDAVYILGDTFANKAGSKSAITITDPIPNAFYRLEINTTTGGSNGFFRLNGMVFNFVDIAE